MKRYFNSIHESNKDTLINNRDEDEQIQPQKQMKQQKLDKYFNFKVDNNAQKLPTSKDAKKEKKKKIFNNFILTLNREINPSLSCSKATTNVFNSFLMDYIDKIATEAKNLARIRGNTFSHRII